MRISHASRHFIRARVVALGAILGLVSFAASAASDTYDWSASLVSFDQATKTAVFRARFEAYADIPGLDAFRDGDRLTLVWTGRSWAAGIRALAEHPNVSTESLMLPVEFVSTTLDDQYLNFRIHVPDSALATIRELPEGSRITVVSPRQPKSFDSAVISMRPYNDVS